MATVLSELITFSRDGEWGQTEPTSGHVPARVIRGTDFADATLGHVGRLPVRQIRADQVARKRLAAGDLIIETAGGTKDRPTGRTMLVTQRLLDKSDLPMVCASFARSITVDRTKVDPAWLHWKLTHHYVNGDLAAYNTQHTGVSRFQWTTCANTWPLELADFPAQRAAAGLLCRYDDLIENNTRRIEILEEMAQTIYREWFVNFRYPGHENALLVDSEIGSIPEGWLASPLRDALHINPKVPVPTDAVVPFVPMTSVSERSMHIARLEVRPRPSGAKFMNGDTLLARITPCLENGKTAYVQCLADGVAGCGSTELITLRSRRLCPEYVYLLARSDDFRAVAIQSMSGATGRQRVRTEALEGFVLAVPPIGLLERFHELVEPMFALSFKLSEQVVVLRHTRDLLLPRLISGEIDVSDMDIDVGELVS